MASPWFDALGAANGTFRCRNTSCRGFHSPEGFSVELRVRAWPQRVGPHGPITISRTERQPYQLPELCSTCGGPIDVIEPPMTSTNPYGGRDLTLQWPVPRVSPGFTGDVEILEPPAPELTLEQRVERLERAKEPA